MANHINVTLIYQAQKQDVRLPVRIEVSHLIRELQQIFKWETLTGQYHIRVANKGLILLAGHHLQDYPVTTGDILVIEEG